VIEGAQVWGERVNEMVEMETTGTVLIVSKHRPLRDSLQSLLVTAPQVRALHVADDVLSALRVITLHRPDLVLIVDDLRREGASMVLRWIKAEGSCSRSLVLTEDGERQQRALTLGADAALLKGFPAAKLLRVIERLVTEPHNSDGSELSGMDDV
jgi:DNA-binding NarL/FixJ family response regulator